MIVVQDVAIKYIFSKWLAFHLSYKHGAIKIVSRDVQNKTENGIFGKNGSFGLQRAISLSMLL